MARDRRGRAGAGTQDVPPAGAPPGHASWRRPRGHALLATAASAAFWAWFAGSPLLFAILVLPLVVAGALRHGRGARIRDPLTVWALAFTTGGTLAALALRFRAFEP